MSMKKAQTLMIAAVIAAAALGCAKPAEAPKPKFLIILQADVDRHEGLARALHALLYSKELAEAGYDVALMFDGAGTGWAAKMRDPENKLHKRYLAVQKLGIVEEICDFCSGAFKVKDKLKEMSVETLNAEAGGHPSIAKWVKKGYQPIIL